jgi:hypothetical protein
MGVKRMLNIHKVEELVNTNYRGEPCIAKRTYELIPTIPTINNDPELSRHRPPDWIIKESEDDEDDEMIEAMAGAGV